MPSISYIPSILIARSIQNSIHATIELLIVFIAFVFAGFENRKLYFTIRSQRRKMLKTARRFAHCLNRINKIVSMCMRIIEEQEHNQEKKFFHSW